MGGSPSELSEELVTQEKLILQLFPHFTFVTTHSTTLPSLCLSHSSFSNSSVASPTSQFILQPFFRFSCVTSILQPFPHFTFVATHSPTLLSLFLSHSSFSNSFVTSPTSQFILQPFFRFSCVTSILIPFPHFTFVKTHSQTLPSLYLRHRSFFNSSVAPPTSQFILQPFFRFSCVTSSSLISPGEPPMSLRYENNIY